MSRNTLLFSGFIETMVCGYSLILKGSVLVNVVLVILSLRGCLWKGHYTVKGLGSKIDTVAVLSNETNISC